MYPNTLLIISRSKSFAYLHAHGKDVVKWKAVNLTPLAVKSVNAIG
jgi:hypothetical protein